MLLLPTILALLLDNVGCSGGCSHEPVVRTIKSVEFQAWQAGKRSSCEWERFRDGLAPAETKCPDADAARDYFMTCSGELNPDQGDRVDEAVFLRYETGDKCVYETRGTWCVK